MTNNKSAVLALAGTLVLASGLQTPAAAKVTFTGYGNFVMTAQQSVDVYGDAPALAKFATPAQTLKDRGFTIGGLGLFATTNIKEGMDFLLDVTYRQIGSTTKQTSIQYAYLEHVLGDDFSYRAGKITLPFGYYNQNRFYAFQRIELSAPVFQSAVLGLPIADIGAAAHKCFRTSWSRIDADFYAVNGYGSSPNDPTKFRSATLPGAIVLSNNLAAENNNQNLAFGGRLTAAELGGRDLETGISYYGGPWNSAGTKYFQMLDAHFHGNVARLDVLTEYLHMDVQGDPGFVEAVNDTHYRTDGYFLTASYPLWRIQGKPLTPYAASEGYVTRGHHGAGQERLQGYRAGLNYKPLDALQIKLEYGLLRYDLPLYGFGDLKLDVHSVLLSLTVTF